MPLTIHQEGLLNDLTDQIKALHHPDLSSSALNHLKPIWGHIHFGELIRAGVVQHDKKWVCERPLENLIKAIADTPFSEEQKEAMFFNAMIHTKEPVPDVQRQALSAAIEAYRVKST